MSEHVAEITESTKFNPFTSIWIVPFIALIIAGWLAYQHFAERGPEIRIIFPQNEGLIAGQSVVKFRNVPVGKVTEIHADEQSENVVVVVRMNTKRSKPYMTENAKFWIVKPEVGLSGVSGLDTLISGTYINVHSKVGGKNEMEKFIGLTKPYRDAEDGTYFHLTSLNAQNVSTGMPVYFKNIKVGRVEYLFLALDNKSIGIIVFIDKKYASNVHDYTKFWTKSMVNIDFAKGNIDIDIAPLNFILQGGIVFASSGEDKNHTLNKNRVFPLYDSRSEAESTTTGSITKHINKFLLNTVDNIANLRVQAPVRFDGFDIGSVDTIKLSYNKKMHKITGQVLIKIDTSVFKDRKNNVSKSNGLANFYEAVEEGLRAKITALDPITGMLFIDLTFNHDDDVNRSIIKGERYAQIPMSREESLGIMTSMSQLLDRLKHLPLDTLFDNLNKVIEESAKPVKNANIVLLDLQKTVKNLNKFTGKKSFEVLPYELSKALKEMTHTLETISKVAKGYDSNSLVKQQLAQTLEVLTKTSQEMLVFLRMLNRKPNSLIFGDN